MIRFAAAAIAAGLVLCGQVVATAPGLEREVGIIGRERLIEALDERATLGRDGAWAIVSG